MIGQTTAVLSENQFRVRVQLWSENIQQTCLSSLQSVNIRANPVNIRYGHREKLMYHQWRFEHLEIKIKLFDDEQIALF